MRFRFSNASTTTLTHAGGRPPTASSGCTPIDSNVVPAGFIRVERVMQPRRRMFEPVREMCVAIQ